MDETPSLDARDVTSPESSSIQQQSGANPGRQPAHVIDVPSHGRQRTPERAHSTPHKVPPMNDVELFPLARLGQRTRAKSTVAEPSSSRGLNLDQQQTSTGECGHGRVRIHSLTITRALKYCSRTSNR